MSEISVVDGPPLVSHSQLFLLRDELHGSRARAEAGSDGMRRTWRYCHGALWWLARTQQANSPLRSSAPYWLWTVDLLERVLIAFQIRERVFSLSRRFLPTLGRALPEFVAEGERGRIASRREEKRFGNSSAGSAWFDVDPLKGTSYWDELMLSASNSFTEPHL